MKALTLSFVLLLLGIVSATGQTAPSQNPAVNAASQKEPALDADTPQAPALAAPDAQLAPRVATRPPTPLVRK